MLVSQKSIILCLGVIEFNVGLSRESIVLCKYVRN